MATEKLKAPFPYFGGKSKIAKTIWKYLGDVTNYLEPFFGSGAVLLSRPSSPKIETVNDIDCHIANFWRATKHDPEGVVEYCNWPVNETDLHAVHDWLVNGKEAAEFRKRMRSDPDYFDAQRAGRWAWGLCCWIGGGWCNPSGVRNLRQSRFRDGKSIEIGVHSKTSERLPFIGGGSNQQGMGVHNKKLSQARPHIGDPYGTGMLGNHGRPQLADTYSRGRGIHGNDAADTCEDRRLWLLDWFKKLQDRFRNVRVCCGHWNRICNSPSTTTRLGMTGMFLDPPYRLNLKDKTNRCDGIYNSDIAKDTDAVVDEVIAYCLKHGGNKQFRIVAACYEGEGYEILLQHGWRIVKWKAHGGYGNRNKTNDNKNRERLFISPHCVKSSGFLQEF